MHWLPFVLWLARDDAAWTFAKYADAASAERAMLRCQLAQMDAAREDVMRRLRNERVMRRKCTQSVGALGLRDELR